jgi:MoaA/NifB/PqqE/SkfB family radical SAM enzyme
MSKFINGSKILFQNQSFRNWMDGGDISPVTFDLHISNSCNNACGYCMCAGVHGKAKMTDSQIVDAVSFIKYSGAKAVVLSGGGEPTVNKHFDVAVSEISKAGMDCGIVTNGINWDAKRIEETLGKATWLRVSFDAVDAEQYKAIRKTDHFAQVVENIKAILQARSESKSKTTIGIQAVITRENMGTIPEFVELCEEEFPGIDYIQLRPVETKLGEMLFSEEERDEILQTIRVVNGEKVFVSDKWDLTFRGSRDFGFSKCHCNQLVGLIDAFGDYYICCHTIGIPEYRFFNIFETPAADRDRMVKETIDGLGTTGGLCAKVCPVGCRGSNINRTLEMFVEPPKHKNFL